MNKDINNIQKSVFIQENVGDFFLNKISNDIFLKFLLLLTLFSYYYNLPVLKYSLIGNNEFRLYDITGLMIIYYSYIYYKFIFFVIRQVKVFNWMRMLLNWVIFTLPITLFFFIFFGDVMSFIQTLLYFYHFYVFFLVSVLLFIVCNSKVNLIYFINFILFFSIFSNLIILLQNYNIVPFLWSDTYKLAYQGFLSGTLGPNKIVLGMTSLFVFALSVGVYMEKQININKLMIIISILLNIYVILISGSRTTYVGLLVFLTYFAIFKTSKFLIFAVVFVSLSIAVVLINGDLYSKIESVVNGRVINKVKNKNDLSSNKVGDLYEDLGSGRDQLTKSNTLFILQNPAIIPFGSGFNNWIIGGGGKSAHNMYLQVIKELGLVGFVLYFGWLINYLLIDFKKYQGFSVALKGLVLSMLVTLFFGEQLYIYRPLFGLLGLFLFVTTIFISILHKHGLEK
jgi:hypothetical protein